MVLVSSPLNCQLWSKWEKIRSVVLWSQSKFKKISSQYRGPWTSVLGSVLGVWECSVHSLGKRGKFLMGQGQTWVNTWKAFRAFIFLASLVTDLYEDQQPLASHFRRRNNLSCTVLLVTSSLEESKPWKTPQLHGPACTDCKYLFLPVRCQNVSHGEHLSSKPGCVDEICKGSCCTEQVCHPLRFPIIITISLLARRWWQNGFAVAPTAWWYVSSALSASYHLTGHGWGLGQKSFISSDSYLGWSLLTGG